MPNISFDTFLRAERQTSPKRRDSSQTLAEMGFGRSNYTVPETPSPHINHPFRAGIEIELEGLDLDMDRIPVSHWHVTGDGSLRNNGYEFVTRGGLANTDLQEALESIHEYLSEIGFSVSERCSTHIHVDMTDMKPQEVVNFVCLSIMLEHVLFRMFGNTRTANTFCVSTDNGTSNYDYMVDSVLNPPSIVDQRWSKYAAIGLKRIRDLGTVEFRMFSAVTEPEQYYRILNLLFAMKQQAKGMSSPADIVEFKLSNTIQDLTAFYFPDVAYSPEFAELFERGIQTLNDILATAEVVRTVKERSKKFETIIDTARRQMDEARRGI